MSVSRIAVTGIKIGSWASCGDWGLTGIHAGPTRSFCSVVLASSLGLIFEWFFLDVFLHLLPVHMPALCLHPGHSPTCPWNSLLGLLCIAPGPSPAPACIYAAKNLVLLACPISNSYGMPDSNLVLTMHWPITDQPLLLQDSGLGLLCRWLTQCCISLLAMSYSYHVTGPELPELPFMPCTIMCLFWPRFAFTLWLSLPWSALPCYIRCSV